MKWPTRGAESDVVWRCSACGTDLAAQAEENVTRVEGRS